MCCAYWVICVHLCLPALYLLTWSYLSICFSSVTVSPVLGYTEQDCEQDLQSLGMRNYLFGNGIFSPNGFLVFFKSIFALKVYCHCTVYLPKILKYPTQVWFVYTCIYLFSWHFYRKWRMTKKAWSATSWRNWAQWWNHIANHRIWTSNCLITDTES